MRPSFRAAVVLLAGFALLVLFLHNVDLRGVASQIVHARLGWLAVSLTTVLINVALRSWRWQYLLEPLGRPGFGASFRATCVGFAASTVLPARAGEVIRPYFLSRQQRSITATGAFATVILERLLDMLTVLTLLALYVLVLAPPPTEANHLAFETVKWAGLTAGAGSAFGLVVLFVLAGNPARLAESLARLERVLPSKLAGLLASVAEKFATGLGAVRRPGRLAVALLLSVPLWLSIAVGIWSVALAFHLPVPFAGSFLIIALLVVGLAVPTPGAVGGFHAAFKFGATTFFAAPDDAAVGAAIVLHLFSVGPTLVLGLLFAAQEGLNLSGMRTLADRADSEGTV